MDNFYKTELEDVATPDAKNCAHVAEQLAAGVALEDIKLIEYKWTVDNYWYFYYLSPHRDVLIEGETSFQHGSHQYSFRIYPFYDRQVFLFVSDFIDQQQHINHLIILQDMVIHSSAKDVLLVPKDCIPEGIKIEDFADMWGTFDGVLEIKTKPDIPPSPANHIQLLKSRCNRHGLPAVEITGRSIGYSGCTAVESAINRHSNFTVHAAGTEFHNVSYRNIRILPGTTGREE